MTKIFIRKYPVAIYFGLTFFISWTGAFLLVVNKIVKNEPIPTMDGIIMFPIMLLGPAISGIVMNYVLGKRSAVRELFGRMKLPRTKYTWLLSLFIPPLLINIVLLFLSVFLSKEYEPGFFLMGILFGIPAGFLEELGWMGFAFPRMIKLHSAFNSSIILGLVWSVWHLPAINFLGAASPHGSDWFVYFLSFTTVMTAVRIIIAWVYVNSKSLLLCQLLHISSTGFLVVFSPSPISRQHEPVWYFFYALLLWVLVGIIYSKYGSTLARKSSL